MKVEILKTEKERFYSSVKEFFESKGWVINRCLKCGNNYYEKGEENNCQSYRCIGAFDFLNLSRKKRLLTLDSLIKISREFFFDKGYNLTSLDSVINQYEDDTFFVVAGVQYFSDFFHDKADLEGGKFLITQPVIRTKFRNNIKEGVISSFVNICSEEVDVSLEDHLTHLDTWLEFLSKLGIYMGNVTLTLPSNEDYGKHLSGFWKKTKGINVGINYNGLNLGDAGWIKIPSRDSIVTLSDIGFGMERLLWATTKMPSFFSLIFPLHFPYREQVDLFDSVRTTTLMLMSGLTKESKDQWYQFNKYIKGIAKGGNNQNYFGLVEYFYNYWKKFIQPQRDVLTVYRLLEGALNKKYNMEFLGGNFSQKKLVLDENPDKLIRKLIEGGSLPLDSLNKLKND